VRGCCRGVRRGRHARDEHGGHAGPGARAPRVGRGYRQAVRRDLSAAAVGHAHGGGTPHESPATITLVLAALAAGAVLVSLLGIPAAWSGHEPLLERWLAPALTAEVRFAEKPHALEYLFQAIGVGAGAVGWFFAMLLYKDGRSRVPAQLKERFLGAWTVVYNKYYVDELYHLVVIRPSLAWSRALGWFDGHILDAIVNLAGAVTRAFARLDGLIDTYVVDGAVNAVAVVTAEAGRSLRRIQTGRVQTYLYGALAGGLAVILLNFLIH
jgi:NADH-quinone oxidoreductase subunit L